MPYADPSRAREAARERYARKKLDPAWVARKRASNRRSYRLNLDENRARKRRASTKSRYQISDAQLDALLAQGACEICQRDDAKLVIDHDHDTGAVRGVLCSGCNTALGWYERPGWREKAHAYLYRS